MFLRMVMKKNVIYKLLSQSFMNGNIIFIVYLFKFKFIQFICNRLGKYLVENNLFFSILCHCTSYYIPFNTNSKKLNI